MRDTFLKAALILALSELGVMGLLRSWPRPLGWLEILLDPTLMLLLAIAPLFLLLRKEEAARLKNEQLHDNLRRIIEELWNASLQTLSREDLLKRILEEVLTNAPISIERKGAIFLVENENLHMMVSSGLTDKLKKTCAFIRPGRCLCGRVLTTGEVVFSAHLDNRHEVAPDAMIDHGHYCIPIKSAGRVIGVLNLYTSPGHARDSAEESFLRSVASIIARIIEGKKLETELLQFQKMEALNRFAAAIAHDFNNILGGIQGFCETAMREVPEDGTTAGDLKEICSVVRKGTALTRQLKLFSRQAAETTEVFDLNELAAGMKEMISRLSGGSINVELALAREQLRIKGSRGQLEQVLLNLAANSRDAMPSGGLLKLETSRQEVCFTRSKQCFSAAKISVSDTGTGMSEAVLDKMFEPFFTTKEEGKGSGLGLSITHGIVKQHGGEILAHSVPGNGSSFDIYLPLNEELKPQGAPAVS